MTDQYAEYDQQYQPTIRSTPYQSPLNSFAGSIILLTNPQNELHQLELDLKNILPDGNGGYIPLGAPLMNDEGVKYFISIAQNYINQVTVMSELKEKMIMQLCRDAGDVINKALMLGVKQFQIRNPAFVRDRIETGITSFIYICMMRASEGGEKKFWKGSTQEITTRVDGAQRRGGMMSKLGWK